MWVTLPEQSSDSVVSHVEISSKSCDRSQSDCLCAAIPTILQPVCVTEHLDWWGVACETILQPVCDTEHLDWWGLACETILQPVYLTFRWFVPFIGHMGICTSAGVIRDFAGPYYVSVSSVVYEYH